MPVPDPQNSFSFKITLKTAIILRKTKEFFMSMRLNETNCFAPIYYSGKSIVEDAAKIARCDYPAGVGAEQDCMKEIGCEETCEDPSCKALCLVYKCVSRLLSWVMLLGNSLIESFGRIFNSCSATGIAQEALDASSGLSINAEMLPVVPDKVDMDKDQLSHDAVKIDDLKTVFRNLSARSSGDIHILEDDVDYYILTVNSKLTSQKENDRELVLYAQNFILKLKDESIPVDKRLNELDTLCKGVRFCQSRVGRETTRGFKRLNGTELSFEQNIRHWVQDLKEEILIEAFGDIHHIDDACIVIGKEWGLDVTAESLADGGARCVGVCLCISDATYRYHLNKNFTPARLIATIHTKILSENCVEQANDYLQKNDAILPENWIQDFFDQTHAKRPLNMRAVAWMLQNSRDLI